MDKWTIRVAALIAACLLGLAPQLCADEAPPPSPADQAAEPTLKAPAGETKVAKDSQVTWLTDLEAGQRQARASGLPLLVRVGAAWCPWCEKLEASLASAEVEPELKRWTLVYVDADDSPQSARQLAIGPIPALRAFDVGGALVVSQDGYLAQDDLLKWLKTSREKASGAAPKSLASDAPLVARDVPELIEALQSARSAQREAAIGRLVASPQLAAREVAKSLREKKLALRLSALELLTQWKAPVEALDPWQPETWTTERQQAVEAWAEQIATATNVAVPGFSPEQIAAAAREIDRLAEANDAEANAVVERLGHFGKSLSEAVTARLKDAATDRMRERLLALKYRLVAPVGFELNWPGGLARLASSDAVVRQRAAGELSSRATSADEPLLVELFGDSDPLVRELALRGLRGVGGDAASGALVTLLSDPEPNVRVAVLKEFLEDPPAKIAPVIAAYVKKETDSDLVVHAVRVLKAAKAAAALIELTSHESWQVRAEAAEALGELATQSSEEKRADIYVALIGMLADSDNFVVSRAIHGLRNSELTSAVEPLVKAALANPALASEAVEILSHSQSMRAAAEPFFRKFLEHDDARVRAGALVGLAASNSPDADKLLIAGLKDPSANVREAAAESLFKLFEAYRETRSLPRAPYASESELAPTLAAFFRVKHRPSDDNLSEPRQDQPEAKPEEKPDAKPADEPQAAAPSEVAPKAPAPAEGGEAVAEVAPPEADEPDESWIVAFRNPEERPQWMNELVAPLEAMLGAESPRERLAAATVGVPLGLHDKARDVLLELARGEPNMQGPVSNVLPWMTWPERSKMFEALMSLKVNEAALGRISRMMVVVRDKRAVPYFWNLLRRDDVTTVGGELAYECLQALYSPVQSQRKLGKSDRKAVEEFAESGNPWQRVIAVSLLVNAGTDSAAEQAKKLYEEAALPAEFRADAFQLLLLAGGEDEASKSAVEKLSSDQTPLRKLALQYLVRGRGGISSVRGAWHVSNVDVLPWSGIGEAIEIQAPAGLTPDSVRPLLASPDPEVAACAGYLMATLGQAEGLEPLVRLWRKQPTGPWTEPLYRAIAVLDDDSQTPILAEIYKKQRDWQHREFYWTIRSMHGPAVLQLRKQIRDEVGMDNLR